MIDLRRDSFQAPVQERQDVPTVVTHHHGDRVSLVEQSGEQGLSENQITQGIEGEDHNRFFIRAWQLKCLPSFGL